MTDLSRIDLSQTDPTRTDLSRTADPNHPAAFAALARRALHEAGYSMRAAARAINYDVAYLSRVLNGKQPPSPKLAASLDRLLDTGGVLGEALRRGLPEDPPGEEPPGIATGIAEDIARLRASTAHLSAHAARYGGEEIVDAAVRLWRGAQARLERGLVPERAQPGYLAALAEAALVAGCLLADAGRRGDAWRTRFRSGARVDEPPELGEPGRLSQVTG